MDVAVIGIGQIPCRRRYSRRDFRELVYEGAKAACADADLSHRDLDAMVASGLEFFEGVSITDSYTPDQVGGRLKFNTLIGNDSLTAFIHGCMLIESGLHDVVLVEGHAKPSEMLNHEEALANSLDPHYLRPLCPHPYVISGLDASAYLSLSGADSSDLSLVAAKNRRNALHNPFAADGAEITSGEVEKTETLFHPIKKGHMARRCDYAGVVILASDRVAKYHPRPVWVRGVGYASCASSCSPELKSWGEARWATVAGRTALKASGVKSKEIDLVEVTEPLSFMELQVLDALDILGGRANARLRSGELEIDGVLPVNPSGGCIGMGYPLTAAGLQRVIGSVIQLRGEAGAGQVSGPRTALVASQDSEISDSGAVVVLGAEEAGPD